MGKFDNYNKKERIAGVFAITGTLVILSEVLFHIYKWFGIHPVIFIIGIIFIFIGIAISTDNRL